jgi:hypothetical protein
MRAEDPPQKGAESFLRGIGRAHVVNWGDVSERADSFAKCKLGANAGTMSVSRTGRQGSEPCVRCDAGQKGNANGGSSFPDPVPGSVTPRVQSGAACRPPWEESPALWPLHRTY